MDLGQNALVHLSTAVHHRRAAAQSSSTAVESGLDWSLSLYASFECQSRACVTRSVVAWPREDVPSGVMTAIESEHVASLSLSAPTYRRPVSDQSSSSAAENPSTAPESFSTAIECAPKAVDRGPRASASFSVAMGCGTDAFVSVRASIECESMASSSFTGAMGCSSNELVSVIGCECTALVNRWSPLTQKSTPFMSIFSPPARNRRPARECPYEGREDDARPRGVGHWQVNPVPMQPQ